MLSKLTQKAGEVLLFPATGAIVTMKFALSPVEFLGMDLAASAAQNSVWHHRVEHLVEENVFQIPARHKCLIQQPMDPNDAIFFLDRSKNKMIFRAILSATAPFYSVIVKPATKVAFVELLEDYAQIEVFAFLPQV